MKKAILFAAFALVVLCGIGGYLYTSMKAAQAAQSKKTNDYKVVRGDLVVSVVDTGTIDAVNSVEVKSRVSGRLSKLLVDEGYRVTQGQVIALIDPQETQFQVAQNQAQLRGAQSGAARTAIEIKQRRVTAQADFRQAESRLRRLDLENQAQPTLTSAAIREATSEYNRNVQERENLLKVTQPNTRSRAVTAQRDSQVNFENAKREFERRQSLLERGFVSAREVESAKLSLDVARLKLDQANDELSRINSEFANQAARATEAVRSSEAALQRARVNAIQNRTKREEFRQALADVDKARAALNDVQALERSLEQNMATVSQLSSVLQDSQRQLRETSIRSPITGVVTKKLLKEGELATGLSGFSAGTPIVRIEDRTNLRVLLNVNEIDVAKMSEGMKATITVDALPNEKFHGTVKRIAPTSVSATPGQTASDAVVKYEVEIRLVGNDSRLRSGMSAKCDLEVIRRNNTILVPKDYVGKDEKGNYFVEIPPATKGGKPTRKDIKIGAESGAQYEVLDGVVVGQTLLRPAYKGPARKGMMQMGPDE
jgi:HlyD family secretion protein